MIAYFTGEGDHRAVFIAFGQRGYSSPTLKRAGLTTIRVCVILASRYRWKERHFVAAGDRMVKRGQRLVDCRQQLALFQGQRPTVAASGKLLTHGFDGRQIAGVESQRIGTHQLAHRAKTEP